MQHNQKKNAPSDPNKGQHKKAPTQPRDQQAANAKGPKGQPTAFDEENKPGAEKRQEEGPDARRRLTRR